MHTSIGILETDMHPNIHSDIKAARDNMIEQQIRPWNVLAVRTLDALKKIPRENFVPAAHRALAFADVQIDLGDGKVMLEPKVCARMVEALDAADDERALEIGTGSGYVTALLATLCAHVTSVDIDAQQRDVARQNLAGVGDGDRDGDSDRDDDENLFAKIKLETGDAHAGWSGTYDLILIGGSLPVIERTADSKWHSMLTVGGRLVGIEGDAPAMSAVRLTKKNETDALVRESLFETVTPRLSGVVERAEFQF